MSRRQPAKVAARHRHHRSAPRTAKPVDTRRTAEPENTPRIADPVDTRRGPEPVDSPRGRGVTGTTDPTYITGTADTMDTRDPGNRGNARGSQSPEGTGRSGGTAGNERLTAMTGAALLVLFAAEGITILSVRGLLTLHFFVGMLLAGPVLLKIGSTGYRFARYYTGAVPYVRKGPPAPLLRLLGPVVVLTSCGVIGTGILLAFAGPGPGSLRPASDAHRGRLPLRGRPRPGTLPAG